MESRKMEIIKQLMDQLQEEMEYSPDDLGARLGRKKPDAMVMIKAEKGDPMEGMEGDMSDDQEGMPMGDSHEGAEMALGGGEEDEDEMFKQRLARLRG